MYYMCVQLCMSVNVCVCVWYWLINHCVPRCEIAKKYTQKNYQTNERKTALDHSKMQSWSIIQCPHVNGLQTQKSLHEGVARFT